MDDGRHENRTGSRTGNRTGLDLDVLDEIQRRVLWLSTRIVDAANRSAQADDRAEVLYRERKILSLDVKNFTIQ